MSADELDHTDTVRSNRSFESTRLVVLTPHGYRSMVIGPGALSKARAAYRARESASLADANALATMTIAAIVEEYGLHP